MKIAIITLPLHANYGGILQAYALQTVLKRMGHSVEVITTPVLKKISFWRMPFSYTKRFLLKFLFRKNVKIFFEQWHNQVDPFLVKQITSFIHENISNRLVKSYYDIKSNEYNAFVVGSDQIWRPKYFDFSIDNAYLSFAEYWTGIKRIAYAPSFGTDEWEYTPKQTRLCRNLLTSFDGISVREESAVKLCRYYLHNDALQVLDPTMLLKASDYSKLFVNKQLPPSSGQLLTYILDESPEIDLLVHNLSLSLNYKPFRVNSRYENLDALLSERVQPSVEQWLKGFSEAKFVITDSFHATVFSILFNKPFVVVENRERGLSRLHSLLKMLGLEKNLLPVGEQLRCDLDYSYDVKAVNTILSNLRNKSFSFLNTHLSS